MRLLIQECLSGSVKIDGIEVSSIGKGEVVFVGFTEGDDQKIIDKMIEKMLNLRIFADSEGKTNINLHDNDGTVLFVSQFTLYSDVTHGNRPSFVKALPGDKSEPLYDYACEVLKSKVPDCQFGVFGADMKVNIVNDGPFTIILDSKELFKK